jgi:hypothetical protein
MHPEHLNLQIGFVVQMLKNDECMCYLGHVTKVMILFDQGSIFDIQTSRQSTYAYTLLILNTILHGVFLFLCGV